MENKFIPLGPRGVLVRVLEAPKPEEKPKGIHRPSFRGDLMENGRPGALVDEHASRWTNRAEVMAISDYVESTKEEKGYKDLKVGSTVVLFEHANASHNYYYEDPNPPRVYDGNLLLSLESIQGLVK